CGLRARRAGLSWFPYTTLFRSGLAVRLAHIEHLDRAEHGNLNFPFLHDDLAILIQHRCLGVRVQLLFLDLFLERRGRDDGDTVLDRESTRLNSSRVSISYAVLC